MQQHWPALGTEHHRDFLVRLAARINALDLPTLTVMEGGYAVKDIGINTVNFLIGLER